MTAPRLLAEFPFTPRFLEVDGHRLAYLDEGSGPPVVMVHGNPSWSYLYRNLVTALCDRYRCIVPDHLGCGFSDKPQHHPYRLGNHLDNLDHLLAALVPDGPVRLIVHDWGGAIGMGWAGRHPERVAGAVVLNTAAFPSPRLPLRIAVCRWPLLGALVVRGLNGFARAAVYMAVTRRMRPGVAAGFLAPYDSWRHRVALHRFVQDIPMGPAHPSWSTLVEIERSLATITCPLLLCWGGRDFCFDRSFYDEWQRRFPAAEAHFFPEAGHYVLEDALAEVLPPIERFLPTTGTTP
ncbi:alpha/beta fold hydrolase [uncultured Desulfobulbus sp.]|uniref:alpha/beta fold hydrolase n=1 Tax=uncultured Desulfobulbus sp. TaxID=239745 RepID=UPI002614E1D7|nr:alpha/beta fold hydrolase [uncultured Desulfobulbus sp.]